MIPRRSPLRDLLPDPNHPRTADIQTRHFFERAYITLVHLDPLSGDTPFRTASEPQRIRSVWAGDDPSGDIAEFEVQIDGVTVVDSVSSGAGRALPKSHPVFNAGSLISTPAIGSTGTPTGPVSIIIELEPFVVTPRIGAELRGRDRLFLSRRREAERINRTIGELKPDASLARSKGLTGYRTRSPERDIRNPDPIKRIDHRFRPRRPR